MPSQETTATTAARPLEPPVQPLACAEELLEAAGPPKAGKGRGQGLPDGCLDVYRQREFEQFSGLISDTGAKKMITEYHKPGAPFMEGDGGTGPAAAADTPETPPVASAANPPLDMLPGPPDAPAHFRSATQRPEPQVVAAPSPNAAPNAPGTGEANPASGAFGGLLKGFGPSGLGQVIDVSTIEIAALTVFRAFFGQGVAIPIKREGFVDMNIVIMGKDVVINTNRLMLEVPELAIWRIVFAYKGRPILEYGRGVPNKIKIHRYRALQLLAGMWWHGLRNQDRQSERMWRKATVLMMERDAWKKAKVEKRRARAARAAEKKGRRHRSP